MVFSPYFWGFSLAAQPPLARGHRGSVPALTALSALTRIFKGGDARTAPEVAGQVVRIAERLLGKLSQTQDDGFPKILGRFPMRVPH